MLGQPLKPAKEPGETGTEAPRILPATDETGRAVEPYRRSTKPSLQGLDGASDLCDFAFFKVAEKTDDPDAAMERFGIGYRGHGNPYDPAICVAAAIPMIKTLQALIRRTKPIDINACNMYGWTAAMMAASRGNTDEMEILIAAKADIGKRHVKDGWTATHESAKHNHAATLAVLIAANVDIDSLTNAGETPTMFAASSGSMDALQLLLQARSNVLVRNHVGKTALQIARQKGLQSCSDLLQEEMCKRFCNEQQGIFVESENAVILSKLHGYD
jgi:hypothetical protein